MRLACRRPALLLLALFAVGCAPEIESYPIQRSPRASLGEEVYKMLCRRIAGTEYPRDVTGESSRALCMGSAAEVEAAVQAERAKPMPTPGAADTRPDSVRNLRLIALAERRAAIARAIDDLLPGYNTANDTAEDLEQLFRRLLPFYDPPEEVPQKATRALAELLERIVDPNDPLILAGLARVTREGMSAPEGALGLIRGSLAASHSRDVGRSVLPVVMDDPAVRKHFETALNGLALELATSELTEQSKLDAARLKQLALRPNPAFSSGKPLLSAKRDARGLPIPRASGAEVVPFPFVDADGDGLADASGPRLLTRPEFTGVLPEPFPSVGEPPVARDPAGQALAFAADGTPDTSRRLYESADADPTLLAGLLRAGRKLFEDPEFASSAGHVIGAVAGEQAPAQESYGSYTFAYEAPNPAKSPLLDLLHGSTALVDRPIIDASLVLTKRLLEEEEPRFVASLEPLLALERRSRPDADAYPNAQLKPDHTLWDELLWELEKISRRRNDATGETLLEALIRATLGFGRNLDKPGTPIEQVADPEILQHQGAVVATLLRFKDEWRANPKGESQRMPGEPLVLGAFRTPVDRTKPETPITCGRDGCGGVIAGTMFERWKQPNQYCVIQKPRRSNGTDCGEPANQSLMHRSLGLMAEMAGRSQCNKAITIGELLDFVVLENPCVGIPTDSPECAVLIRQQRAQRQESINQSETAVAKDYTCHSPSDPCAAYMDKYPAAFVDPDGPVNGVPATIQACHMLEIPDVGRSFGDAVLHQFRLQFPNPWVFRYLEDIGRADGTLPPCTDGGGFDNYPIRDPYKAPNCTPDAARLSRDLYQSKESDRIRMQRVHTLADLVEFLLDDTTLFGTDARDRAELRPNVKSLSRVLFAPAGSSSFAVFDPLLVHGAPEACSARPGLPECTEDESATPGGCCIKDMTEPPIRYRLDTYYGATTFAWEYSFKLASGREISFLDTMKPVSDAAARFDFDARRGDDPTRFEDTSYVFSTLGKIVAEHWDSSANPFVQTADPKAPHYRRGTGLVTYEAMMADALDDGSLDRAQLGPDGLPLFAPEQTFTKEQQLGALYHSLPLLSALDRMEFTGGLDGIDVSAEVAEQLLNPHARCAGNGDRRVIAGEGACHRFGRDAAAEKPFTYRDGRQHVCWSDGRCFDGTQGPRRFVSPLFAMLDALSAIDRAVRVDPARDRSLRQLIASVARAFGQTQDGYLSDRNLRALLLEIIAYTGERLGEERKAGTLATFAARSDEDAAEMLHNPVIAGALGVFEGLYGKGTALRDLGLYAASSLSEDPAHNNFRPLLAGLYDFVELLPGDAETNAALRAFGAAFATDVSAALRGTPGVALLPMESALGRNLVMLRRTAEFDDGNVMERVLQNLARIPADRPSPLDVILEAVIEINRPIPGEGTTPTADDLRAVLTRIKDVMKDERRGFERLYDILRCSRGGPREPNCD